MKHLHSFLATFGIRHSDLIVKKVAAVHRTAMAIEVNRLYLRKIAGEYLRRSEIAATN
jgi:hypothetical protein